MVYSATLSQFKRVIYWRIILKEFGPYIQNIYVYKNILSDTLIILPSATNA